MRVNSLSRMGFSVVTMFGVEQVTIHLFSHIEGVTVLQIGFIDFPLTTNKDENRATRLVELIVGQVPLKESKEVEKLNSSFLQKII
jgi:hypothetical protein